MNMFVACDLSVLHPVPRGVESALWAHWAMSLTAFDCAGNPTWRQHITQGFVS